MPWESRTVENQRREFAQAAESCRNFSALCREYGITRKTGMKWKERYEASEPLTDRSKKPHTSPTRTPERIEKMVLEVRADNPGWGAKKIRNHLLQSGHQNVPCAKTVNNILNRYGCISPEESQKHQAFVRFEKELCNQMWHLLPYGQFRSSRISSSSASGNKFSLSLPPATSR